MRTIKFRGKSLETGKWIKGSLLINEDGAEIADESSCIRSLISVDLETVGQFSEKTDLKGNEIYEGDILEYKNPDYQNHKPYVERWSEEDCCFECVNEDNFMLPGVWGEMKIIGNVVENKELLNEEVIDFTFYADNIKKKELLTND